MIFHPANTKQTEGRFIFEKSLTAAAHPCLCKEIFSDLWKGFSYHLSSLQTTKTNEIVFCIGEAMPLPRASHAYSISVTSNGICITAASEKDLILGFMTLIDRIYTFDRGEVQWRR